MYRIGQRLTKCREPAANENLESKSLAANPISQTDAEEQGNLLREYEQQFAELPGQQKLTKLCSHAGFPKNIDKGQFFITLDEEGPDHTKTSCREYTLLRSEKISRVRGWIRGNTKIGPVLDVKVCYHQERCGVEIMIESFFRARTVPWVRIVNGINKYVSETSEEILVASVENRGTGQPVANAKLLRPKLTLTLSPVSIPYRERKWSRKIHSRLFWCVKINDQIVATWWYSSSRRWWSSKIWRLGRNVQGKVCWYFAMVNCSLDNFLGIGRTEEKVSVLLETELFRTFHVLLSNPGTFRRFSRWSYIARHCTVAGWLRRVHLPHRERSRHALHHPGRIVKRDRQSVFFTAVNPMYASRHLDEVQYDLDKPRITVYKKYLECSPKYIILVQFETRSEKRIAVLSNAIARNRSFQHTTCDLYWVVYMKTGEDTPNSQHGRQDPSDLEARKSTDHQSEHSVKYRETCRSHFENTRRKHLEENQRVKYKETCRGNVDYRIQEKPHSTVQKEDSNRKEIEKRLIQQFENHPNRDSLMEDLRLRNSIRSAKSRRSWSLAWATPNTLSFARPLLNYNSLVALYIGKRALYCTCEKCMKPTERNRQLNKARYDVLSILGYVIKKNPTHGARHGTSVRQCMYYKAWYAEEKPASTKVVITTTFWTDGTMMTNTASLCQILGGLRNRSFNTMTSHWKTTPTWLHGKEEVGTRSHGQFLWMHKVFKGHWISAVTLK